MREMAYRYLVACFRDEFSFPYSRAQGMHGLANYGLSCCVNALLQSFSVTWELIDLLNKWEGADLKENPPNVPLQLRLVLEAMQIDQSQPVNHKVFLRCLDKNEIGLNIQHDADEVFLSIMNLIEQQMDNKVLAGEIQSLYRISVESHLECLECTWINSGKSYLLSLPLHIREGENYLEEIISSFFEVQELNNNNKFRCLKCEKKTLSVQGFKLVSLPPVLCIHLKRFRNHNGSTKKLHCKVTFTETIDFSTLLKENMFSEHYTKSNCSYSLYAVIVHCGSAMFGHYTAYVRHREDQSWYYADDSTVLPASWKDVQTTYDGSCRGTAYMLLYRQNKEDQK